MAGKQPGIMLYFDVRPSLKRLSIEEKGILFEAILEYGEHGVVPNLDGVLGVAWDFIQPRLDRDRQRYEEISQKRAEAASFRWGKERGGRGDANACFAMQTMPTTTSTSASNVTQKNNSRAYRFNEPTVEQVAAYCRERNNVVDPQQFVDYYAANGWKVGRNSMKDWKAAVRTWERKDAGGKAGRTRELLELL